MRSLLNPSDHDQLRERLDSLRSVPKGRWGRMSSHQAVCHLNDWFRGVLGDRPIPGDPPTAWVKFMRWVAFTTPLPWPKGFRTAPMQDQELDGTPPIEFTSDVAALQDYMVRFVEKGGREMTPHWRWGNMDPAMWGRYAYRHVDHHLRQFGA